MKANLSGSCITNPTNLACSNDCPLVTNPPFGSFSNQFCKHDGNIFYLFQGKIRLKGVFRTILEHPLDATVGGWDNDPDIYDVNKDGFPDLVVTDESGNNKHIWIYFNPNGCGNFSQNTRITVVNDIESIDEIDAGDADNDGDIDLFTVGHSNYDEDVVLLINSGNSNTWYKCVICMNLNGSCNNSTPGSGEAEGIATGDLDNDGDLDIAVTHLNDGSVYWFERLPNNSNSGFGCNNIDGKNHRYNKYQIYSGGTGTAWDVWIEDINNDGRKDIIVTTQREVMWFRNNGGNPPTFTKITIENNPNANFYALWVKDINSDGDLDVIVTDRAGRVKIYRNDGLGNFPNTWWITLNVNNPMGVVVADLEPDGDQDIFVASYVPNDKIIYIFENTTGNVMDNQNIIFNQITPINVPNRSYFGLGVGDVDGDADPDLVVRAGTYQGQPEGLYWYSTELLYVNRGILISNIVNINGQNLAWKLQKIEVLGFDPATCSQVIPNIQFYYRYVSSSNYQDIYNQNWIGPITTFPYIPNSNQMVKFIQYMIIINSLNNNEKTPVIDEVRFIFDTTITPVNSPELKNNYLYRVGSKIKFLRSGELKIIKANGLIYKQMFVNEGYELELNKGVYIIEFKDREGVIYRDKLIF